MNDFDKELLASNLIGAKTIKELSIKEQLLTTDKPPLYKLVFLVQKVN